MISAPDAPDQRVLGRETELLVEMVGQRVDRAHDVLEGQVLAVLLATSERSSWSSNMTAVSVERQVVGLGARWWRWARRPAAARPGVVVAVCASGEAGASGLFSVSGATSSRSGFSSSSFCTTLLQLERRELEQLDRLLQQRGHDGPAGSAESRGALPWPWLRLVPRAP